MKLNNQTIPSPMDNKGSYRWEPPPIIGRNGQGAAITGTYASVTWEWAALTPAEYGFWITTLLQGQASATYTTNCQLYDHTQTLKTLTHCTVLRPTYERIENGLYIDVSLTIDQILT